MALEIRFASNLNGTTVNEKTCSIKNEKGKTLKCRLRYNEQNKSIQVLTHEPHEENANYYLVISDAVKTLDGGTMGEKCQIRFKIFDENLVEQLTLRGSQCKQFELEKPKEPKKIEEPKIDFPEIDTNHTVTLPFKQKIPSNFYILGFSMLSIVFAVAYCLKRLFL